LNNYNYHPIISIITVNFNGKRFLKDLFNSIAGLEYPRERIQTIMVDNGSKDNSCDFVRENFPWVNILRLDRNYGYSSGNNEGFKIADGEFIALINNDCIVEKKWLSELVNAAVDNVAADKKADKKNCQKFGAVCPKVLFFHSYLPLEFSIDKANAKISNVKIKSKSLENNRSAVKLNESIKYLKGFLPVSRDNIGYLSSWTFSKNSLIAIPVFSKNPGFTLEFEIISEFNSSKFEIFIINPEDNENRRVKKVHECVLKDGLNNVCINFNDNLEAYSKDIINSCGLEINRNFYARDRGFNSFDDSQFVNTEEIFSPSGSSMLINRALLDEVGYFDRDFFTYYEDLDLFWRARLKGWKVYFTPYSVVRHYHCGTGREWSYSFTYHVLRNRLIAIFKSGWWFLFFKNCFSFFVSILAGISQYLYSILRGKKQDRPDIRVRLRVFFELFYWLPKKLFYRIMNRRAAVIKDREIKKWFKNF